MESFFIVILSTIFLATILNVFLKMIHIPTIIGYIFSGLAITHMFDLHDLNTELLSHIAEFGIVFLMFTIGLEFSVKHLVSMKKEVFLFGFLQVFLTGNLFGAFAHEVLGIELKTAIILGFAASLSSTAIVLKMLNENGEIHSGYGRKALGILLFQDLAVIPILLMISIFTSENASVSSLLFETFVDALIVLFILFVIGKYFINRFFLWITSVNSEEIFLVSVIFIVVGASFFAHIFGFSYSLGAFIAGMTIAETKFKYRIEADLIPFRDILLGIFFVTVGMQINLSTVYEYGWIVLLLLGGFMLFKALIIFITFFYFTKIQRRTALKTALALSQVGEFALAILSLANSNHLIDNTVNQIMIVTVVLSMILTPFILRNIKSLADMLFEEPEIKDTIASSGYKHHVVICGYGPLGQKIAKKLKELDIYYVVIEHAIKLVTLGRERKEPIILGNAAQKSTLEALNVQDSIAIIVAMNNEHKIRLVCEALSSFQKPLNTIVKVANKEEQKAIEDLHINHIINESEEIANKLIEKTLTCKIK